MKYIDAEKLKAEIERFSATEYGDNTLGDDVANGALDYVLEEIIPSLRQEQPESLEALMYAIDGKWEMIKPTSYLSRRLEDLYEGLVNSYNVNEVYLDELPRVASAGDVEALKELKRKIDASMEQKEQEPAEWSKEDEDNLRRVTRIIEDNDSDWKELTEWLKSLRPTWKPSDDLKKL